MSNLPVYQELARRIGLERMRNPTELDYGNGEISRSISIYRKPAMRLSVSNWAGPVLGCWGYFDRKVS